MNGAMIASYFHFPNMNFSHFFSCTFTDTGTTSQSEAVVRRSSEAFLLEYIREQVENLGLAVHDPAQTFSDNQCDTTQVVEKSIFIPSSSQKGGNSDQVVVIQHAIHLSAAKMYIN